MLRVGGIIAAETEPRAIVVSAVQGVTDSLIDFVSTKRNEGEVQHFISEIRGRHLNLLASGRVVNLAAGEGHPAAVMDVSFALQALAAEHLARHGAELERRVLDVPRELDDEVARLKLAAFGVEVDEPTEEQLDYRQSWLPG